MKNRSIKKMTGLSLLTAVTVVLALLSNVTIGTVNLNLALIPIVVGACIYGPSGGLFLGIVLPLFRSLTLSMPPLYPTAIAMAFEMGAYGLITGLLNKNVDKPLNIVLRLLVAMLAGRLVWGTVMWMFALTNYVIEFNLTTFVMGAFITAWPGIITHLVLVPLTVLTYRKLENN